MVKEPHMGVKTEKSLDFLVIIQSSHRSNTRITSRNEMSLFTYSHGTGFACEEEKQHETETTHERNMTAIPEERVLCGICSRDPATMTCNGCGKPLCRNCRVSEIDTSACGEITIRDFCPDCRRDHAVNHRGRGEKSFGLGEITEMVNSEQVKNCRFTIKLKMN